MTKAVDIDRFGYANQDKSFGSIFLEWFWVSDACWPCFGLHRVRYNPHQFCCLYEGVCKRIYRSQQDVKKKIRPKSRFRNRNPFPNGSLRAPARCVPARRSAILRRSEAGVSARRLGNLPTLSLPLKGHKR